MTTDLDSQVARDPATDPHYERLWLILLVVLVAQVMIHPCALLTLNQA